jgi:hypothetical protein
VKNKTRVSALAGAAAIAVTALCTASSCGGGTSNGQQQENKQQSQDTTSLEQSQPIPHYNWSQIRQTAIDAENIAANGTQTTSFFFMMGDQDPIFSCPSIGMPVANTAQLSNPQQVVTQDSQGNGITGSATVGQMDPDGVYAPSSSSGTYVICVNSSGADYLQYWEGDVMTVAAAAEWNTATHTLKVIGAPTAAIHTAPATSEKAPAK